MCRFKRNVLYHISAAFIRKHILGYGRLNIQDSDTRGAKDLMAGKSIEITPQLTHVYFKMSSGLSSVNKGYGPCRFCHRNHFLGRAYGAQHVGYMGKGRNPRPAVKKAFVFL